MTAPDLNLARLMGRVLAALRGRGAETPTSPAYNPLYVDYNAIGPKGRHWLSDGGKVVPNPQDDGWGPVLVDAARGVGWHTQVNRLVGEWLVMVDSLTPEPRSEAGNGATMTEAVTRALAAALGVG